MMERHVSRLESRTLFTATPALYATGGGSYLTEFDPGTGAVIATITAPAGEGSNGVIADAADRSGDVYLIDRGTRDIVRADAETHVASLFVASGTPVDLSDANHIAVAKNGTVVVTAGSKAFAFSPAGKLLARSSSTTGYVGVTATPDGHVMLFEFVPRISLGFSTYIGQRHAPSTLAKVGRTFSAGNDGATEAGQSAYEFGADGQLYVSAPYPTYPSNSSVSVLNPATGKEGTSGAELIGVRGSYQVAVDAKGLLYWVNSDGALAVRHFGTDSTDRAIAEPMAGTNFDLPLFVAQADVVTPTSPTATPPTRALYATGGGSYLTEFDPSSGAVIATITAPAGTGTAGITALAADQAGDVFVADASSGSILRVDAATHVASVFVAAGTGGLGTPVDLTVTGDGAVAVLDASTLYEFSSTGTLAFSRTTNDNVAIGTGPDGLLYLFQTGLTSIGFVSYTGQRYLPSGIVAVGSTFTAGTDYRTSDVPPASFDFGADGNLYVTANDFDGVGTTSRSTTATIITPQTGVSTGTSVPVDDHGGTDNAIAVDTTGDLFAVGAAGEIDVRSATTGAVTRQLVGHTAGGSPFGDLLYVPVTVPATPTVVNFGGKAVGRVTTSTGTVTVRLRGPGSGILLPSGDGYSLTLTGTTAKSTVSVTGPAGALILGVRSDGAIGSLNAPHSTLAGDVSIAGSAGALAFGAVSSGSALSVAGPLKSLTVASWAAGTSDNASSITAPSIGTLVSRGAFAADVTLTGVGQSLRTASFGSLAGVELTSAGSIGTITVKGDVASSTITVSTLTDTAGRLTRFSQTGKGLFSNTMISAYALGAVSAGQAASTDGTLTGISAHTVGSVHLPPLQGGKTLHHLDGAKQPVSLNEANVVVQVA